MTLKHLFYITPKRELHLLLSVGLFDLHECFALNDKPLTIVIVCCHARQMAVPQPNVVICFWFVSKTFVIEQDVVFCVNHDKILLMYLLSLLRLLFV